MQSCKFCLEFFGAIVRISDSSKLKTLFAIGITVKAHEDFRSIGRLLEVLINSADMVH